ncbi:hypothetical protein Ssi03_56700 [Sphaerisporangium siamense]|nr:hypothetical protein Ssi03_56700 [Sphaerisporangium siamense]
MSHSAAPSPAERGSAGRRGLPALATAAALTLTCLALTGAPAVAETPAVTDGPARFHHQALDRHACTTGPDDHVGEDLDAAGARCAEVVVPLDHRKPGGRTISVAISRIKATDPAQRRGILLGNPGGPGESGLHMARLGQAAPALGSRYDTIGWTRASSAAAHRSGATGTPAPTCSRPVRTAAPSMRAWP